MGFNLSHEAWESFYYVYSKERLLIHKKEKKTDADVRQEKNGQH